VQHYVLQNLLKVIHFKSPSLHVSTNVGHRQVLKLLGEETDVFCCWLFLLGCSLLLCVVLRVLFSNAMENTTQQHKQQNRRQHFPRPIILTPDDDHIVPNM
jgi:hypothetical protein